MTASTNEPTCKTKTLLPKKKKKKKVGKCTRQFSEVYICVKTPNSLHFRKNSFLLQENFKSGEFK